MTVFFKFHEPTAFDVLRVNEDSNEVTLAGILGIGTDGVWVFMRFEGDTPKATPYPDTDLLSILQQIQVKVAGSLP